MKDANSLRGEERRVISTKLYRPEFVNFMKLCEDENKSVHAKLREMIGEEIKKNFGDIFTELQKKVPISKPDKEQADFKYQFSGEFDPTFSPIDMKEYEKKKYLEGILPKIEKLKEEVKKNNNPTKKEKIENFEFMMNTKSNHRNWTFEYENGEIYPKDVEEPDIRIIQYAEPHVFVTDLYDEDKDWYHMPNLIRGFAEEAYLSYQLGLFLSSIASAINCCEYILKYEYLRHLNNTDKTKAEEKSKDKYFTLGTFIQNGNKQLEELKINNFQSSIEYLNDVRISLYHFSPDKEGKATAKGKLEVEKHAHISDDMVLPIVSFRIYSIMMELINNFYGKENSVKYADECVTDWMKKRGLKKEDLVKEIKK
ncbi:hypothetical protein J4481_00625 [Candidatus Pacearchaeota archaeon]|nr:hypothetical protein [Candidatus Pacearchaeota archaeon]